MNDVRITIDGATIEALQRLVGEINRYQTKRATMVAEVVDAPEWITSYRAESAKRIHGTRTRKGMTLETLSELANVSVRDLEQIEAGIYWPKDGRILMDIAHALGLQAFDLDPRFDPGGPLSSVQNAPVIHSSPYIQEVGPRKLYPERLEGDGKDSEGSG